MVEKLHTPLPFPVTSAAAKAQQYQVVLSDIKLVLQDEPDWVAAMSTVASMLHNAFDAFHWTGFYCVWPHTGPQVLVVGPYQGTLGCLRIPLNRGVCGAAASSRRTQLVPDVHSFPGHIACASSTQSEVVVPVVTPSQPAAAAATATQQPGQQQQTQPEQQETQSEQQHTQPQQQRTQPQQQGSLLAVLDVDSNYPAAFDDVDAQHLEELCSWLGAKYAGAGAAGGDVAAVGAAGDSGAS